MGAASAHRADGPAGAADIVARYALRILLRAMTFSISGFMPS
jgi:hypothetical protein